MAARPVRDRAGSLASGAAGIGGGNYSGGASSGGGTDVEASASGKFKQKHFGIGGFIGFGGFAGNW